MAAATHAVVRHNVDVAASKTGFDCSPAPIGGGTFPTIRSNTAGTIAWWYCPVAGGEWRIEWAVATAAQLSARNWMTELRAVLGAIDRRAAFDALVTKNVKQPLDSPALTAVWHPYIAEMNAGKPVALPMAGLSNPSDAPRIGTLDALLAAAP